MNKHEYVYNLWYDLGKRQWICRITDPEKLNERIIPIQEVTSIGKMLQNVLKEIIESPFK